MWYEVYVETPEGPYRLITDNLEEAKEWAVAAEKFDNHYSKITTHEDKEQTI